MKILLGGQSSVNILKQLVSNAPTAVSAVDSGSGRAFNNGAATVSFTAPTSGATPTSYTATSSPGGLTGTGPTSPILVTGLTSGTSYTFTVRSENAAGSSAASTPTSAVTATTVPAAPTNVTAVDIGTNRAPTNAAATVTFTAGATGGRTVTGFAATSVFGGDAKTGSSSPVTAAGYAAGDIVAFTVTATNNNGTSEPSTASSMIPLSSIPGAPNVGVFVDNDSRTVGISWTFGDVGKPITSVSVLVTNTSTQAVLLNSSIQGISTAITNVPVGSYSVVVSGTNANGTGASTTESFSRTPPPVTCGDWYISGYGDSTYCEGTTEREESYTFETRECSDGSLEYRSTTTNISYTYNSTNCGYVPPVTCPDCLDDDGGLCIGADYYVYTYSPSAQCTCEPRLFEANAIGCPGYVPPPYFPPYFPYFPYFPSFPPPGCGVETYYYPSSTAPGCSDWYDNCGNFLYINC